MIIMDIKLNNFLAFQNFSMNMSYPKRIVNSFIKDEFLSERPNFRYKKIVILMGANATGKTSLGKMLNHIFNFIARRNSDNLIEAVSDKNSPASFSIDFIPEEHCFSHQFEKNYHLYRLEARFTPDKNTSEYEITASCKKIKILKHDNYETARSRLDKIKSTFTDYINVVRDIPRIGFFFSYPMDVSPNKIPEGYNENYRKILEIILRVLDNSIVRVERVQEAQDSYNIHMLDGRNILIQEGQPVNDALLSSGTKAGIAIAEIITAMKERRCGFYYCDERFSYIQSDVERAILAIMSDFIGNNEQLFFTTHNSDILRMHFPKHSFSFMKKIIKDGKIYISCINADTMLKRNTDSIRHAVENDLFSTAPDTDLLFEIKNT